jgi:hypothetical protein
LGPRVIIGATSRQRPWDESDESCPGEDAGHTGGEVERISSAGRQPDLGEFLEGGGKKEDEGNWRVGPPRGFSGSRREVQEEADRCEQNEVTGLVAVRNLVDLGKESQAADVGEKDNREDEGDRSCREQGADHGFRLRAMHRGDKALRLSPAYSIERSAG